MLRRLTLETLVFAAASTSIISVLSLHAGSGSAESTEIKTLLEKQVRDRHLVGVAAIVIRSNTIVGIAAAGVKRQGEKAPLGPADMFHLGSNTKAITATLVARLVEAGKLSWTTTALQLFPELDATIHPAFGQITLEQLLSHHAGIPPFTQPKSWPKLSGSAVEQRYKFTAWVLEHKPVIAPGTTGLYSNGGFVIAAAMAERKTGSSWEDLVTSQVFEPLQLHAMFEFPLAAARNQPWGHTEIEKGYKAVKAGAVQLPLYLLPAGSIAMTLDDYGRFLQMNLKGLRGEDDGFLATKTIQRLHRSTMEDEYALGWGAYRWDGVPTSTHAGSAGSFYAIAALQPQCDVGVAVVLNSGGERSSEVADSLLKAFLKRYSAPPR